MNSSISRIFGILIFIVQSVQGYENDFLSEKNLTKCAFINVNESSKLYDKNKLYIGISVTNSSDPSIQLVESKINFTHLSGQVLIHETIKTLDQHQSELCVLYTNLTLQQQFISCIQMDENQLIPTLNHNSELRIRIQTSNNNSICKQLQYYQKQFYILCNENNYKIYGYDREGQIQHKYELPINIELTSQCSIKYQLFEDHIIYALYLCQEWSVYRVYQVGETELILNSSLIDLLNEDPDSYKQLYNIKIEQMRSVLIFKKFIYQISNGIPIISTKLPMFEFLQLLEDENLVTQSTDLLKNLYFTQSVLSLFDNTPKFNNVQKFVRYYLRKTNQKLFFLAFSDYERIEQNIRINNHLVYLFRNQFYQMIDVEFQQIIPCHTYFVGVVQDTFMIFSKLFSAEYYPHQNFTTEKYVVTYYQQEKSEYIFDNCFKIDNTIISPSELIIEINYLHLSKLYVITEQQSHIQLDRNLFVSNLPTQITLEGNDGNFSLINEEQFEIMCPLNEYFPNYKEFLLFFILQESDDILTLLQGQNSTVIIFNCIKKWKKTIGNNVEFIPSKVRLSQNKLIALDKLGLTLFIVDLNNISDDQTQFVSIFEFEEEVQFVNGQVMLGQNNYLLLQSKANESGVKTFVLDIRIELMKQITLQNNQQKIENYSFMTLNTYVILYQNKIVFVINDKQMQILTKQAELINTDCYFSRQQTICCLLLVVSHDVNQIQYYFMTQYEFTLLTFYDLQEYKPIQPTDYVWQFQRSLFVIKATKFGSQNIYFLIFQLGEMAQINLKDIIVSEKDYILLCHDYFIYYGKNNQLITQQHNQIKLNINQKNVTKLCEKHLINFQFKTGFLGNEKIQIKYLNITLYIYYDFSNIIVKEESEIIFDDNQAIIQPNKYLQGPIKTIQLLESTDFKLLSPIRVQQQLLCDFYYNRICLKQGLNGPLLKNFNDLIDYEFLNPEINQIVFMEKYQSNPNKYIVVKLNVEQLQYIVEFFEESDLQIILVNFEEIYNAFALEFQSCQIVQNLFVFRYFYSFETIYLIDDNKLIPIKSNQIIGHLIHIQNNTFVGLSHTDDLCMIKLFKLMHDEFIVIKDRQIESREIQKRILMQYQFPLDISIVHMSILKFEIQDDYTQIQFDIALANNRFGIFTFIFTFDSGLKKIKNFKRKSVMKREEIQCIFTINDKYLVIHSNDVSVYQISSDNDLIDPIHIINDANVIPLNTTHFLLVQQIENRKQIRIATIQDWQLLFVSTNVKEFKKLIQFEVQGKLQDSVILSLSNIIQKGSDKFLILHISFSIDCIDPSDILFQKKIQIKAIHNLQANGDYQIERIQKAKLIHIIIKICLKCLIFQFLMIQFINQYIKYKTLQYFLQF